MIWWTHGLHECPKSKCLKLSHEVGYNQGITLKLFSSFLKTFLSVFQKLQSFRREREGISAYSHKKSIAPDHGVRTRTSPKLHFVVFDSLIFDPYVLFLESQCCRHLFVSEYRCREVLFSISPCCGFVPPRPCFCIFQPKKRIFLFT